MIPKRVLLMHISKITGHHCASMAIEKALRQLDKNIEVRNIDIFSYTNPFLEWLTNKIYLYVIKHHPELWDHLYDNADVFRKVKRLRAFLHAINVKKIKKIFEQFRPDIIACTQAFPCGMVGAYKHKHHLSIPLIGILTDYAPHFYWINSFVDIYVVPDQSIEQRFMQRGVPQQRLVTLGIPIDSKFSKQVNPQAVFKKFALDINLPTILIMGGGQGLGPMKAIAGCLDKLNTAVQLIVVCGTNKRLFNWLTKNKANFSNPIVVVDYTEEVESLMSICTFIVTKPGGLTSAEALSKSLPMLIVNPLPGQESQNTQFLLQAKVALKVNNLSELQSLAQELLNDSDRLTLMRKQTGSLAHPDSALNIARLILDIVKA